MIWALNSSMPLLTNQQNQMKMRTIQIDPALNGYIVKCGCQTVVYNSIEHLLSELADYLRDPAKTEKRYIENAVNKMEGPMDPQTCGQNAQAAYQTETEMKVPNPPVSPAPRRLPPR